MKIDQYCQRDNVVSNWVYFLADRTECGRAIGTLLRLSSSSSVCRL